MSLKMTNFAKSNLAIGISDTDVSCTVAVGEGALFPTLGVGDYFYAVLVNSSAQREIVKVTARATDVMTMDRGQEGMTARAYLAGDIFSHRFTAASAAEFITASTFQSGILNYLTNVAGTDTITATVASLPPSAYFAGAHFILVPANTNTGPVTVNVAALGGVNVTWNNEALVAGDLVAGIPVLLIHDGTDFNASLFGIGSRFSTGDVKLTLKTVADPGWVLFNDGTIGNAASGGTTRANADTEALFTLLWNNTADAQCAVSTGRGASAAADYAANKTIALPKALGRALATYGAGSDLTSRALALATGAETHTLTTAELAAHTHGISVDTTTTSGGSYVRSGQNLNGTASTNSSGSGAAHNNMQPTLFLNTMVKL